MVLSTLQTAGILVGISYYLVIMRNSQRNQQLALENRQVSTYLQSVGFRDKEFMNVWADIIDQEYSDFEEWELKYGRLVNRESWSSFFAMANLYQSIGYLVDYGVLTPELVYDQEGELVILTWETQKMGIDGTKEKRGFKHLFDHYESLYNHMIRIRDKESNQ
jgi:hypothetical protein